MNNHLQHLINRDTPIDDQWVGQVAEEFRQNADDPRRLRALAGVIARRMPELLRHLSESDDVRSWDNLRDVMWTCPQFDRQLFVLSIDYFRAWYHWLVALQTREGRPRERHHKGAPAYNVAFNLLKTDRDRARRWARIALIEDALRYHEPENVMAAWFLQTFLHEPEGELQALMGFVREQDPRGGDGSRPVPEGILWYPDQVLANYAATRRPIRTTECDLFEPNLHSLMRLLEGVDNATDRWRALEDMAVNLFGSVNGFEVRSVREQTKSAEQDVVVRNLVTEDPVVAEFGPYLLVECKNWKERAGARVIRDLVSRVRSLGGKCGVLLSNQGVTGMKSQDRVHADLEIVKAFHHDEVYVMVLTREDLGEIAEGRENLLKLMVDEYERVKFDRKTRWGSGAAQ